METDEKTTVTTNAVKRSRGDRVWTRATNDERGTDADGCAANASDARRLPRVSRARKREGTKANTLTASDANARHRCEKW